MPPKGVRRRCDEARTYRLEEGVSCPHKVRVRHLFPGSNTPKGFYSYYDFIMPPERATRIFILKGGPGVGKSTLMKRLGKEVEEQGYGVEYHHCSADPGSFDAVAVPALGVAVLDGTHPHVIDPKYPGALDEIVHLGEYLDDQALRAHRAEIAVLRAESGQAYQRAYRYLAASRIVYDEIEAINSRVADFGRLNQMAEELIERSLPATSAASTPGSVRRLFGSAITPHGPVNYLDSIVGATGRASSSGPGTGRSTILEKTARAASERSFAVECFHCPFDPERVEHLVIPELDVSITTSARPHIWKGSADMVVDTHSALATEPRHRNRREIEEAEDEHLHLFHMAISSLKQARARHDELERLYIPCMDFARLDGLYHRVRQEVLTPQRPRHAVTCGGV